VTLCTDLEILCTLAERELATAARDISNAGLLGSLAMLLEGAGLGAEVELGRIQVPPAFTLTEWLKVYPSYGFVLTCPDSAVHGVLGLFRERGIWSDVIGTTDSSRSIRLRLAEEEAVFLDLSRVSVLGAH
jgi:hypothetical protein